MKLKESIVINSVADDFVAIDTKIADNRFNGMVKLNKTAKDILEILKNDISEEDLLKCLAKKYDVNIEDVKEDVLDIISKLQSIGFIVD